MQQQLARCLTSTLGSIWSSAAGAGLSSGLLSSAWQTADPKSTKPGEHGWGWQAAAPGWGCAGRQVLFMAGILCLVSRQQQCQKGLHDPPHVATSQLVIMYIAACHCHQAMCCDLCCLKK